MDRKEAKERIEKLRDLIEKYRYSRHVLDKELVPIELEDSLKKELFDLEQKFPEFITPDSPSQRVGGKPLDKFEKVRHIEPMLSFNDAFSKEDMVSWIERISKLLSKEELSLINFYCEPKLDGLAIELVYENGIFELGSTRGDGIIGENVTQNLKTIESLPLKLNNISSVIQELKKIGLDDISQKSKEWYKEIVVRGEVVISKKNFELINLEQKRKGEEIFANPRNLAAGSIRQLDPKITASRRLDIFLYDIVTDIGQKTHQEEHLVLDILGFKTNNKYSKFCSDLQEVFNFYDYWNKKRDELPYEIDGIVVQINNNSIFKKLGVIGKAPRGAVAFKFPLKYATTVVEDIVLQVGRTGAITPVAVLKPVQVGGVTITRATLHNEEEIKKLGLKIGDTVAVGRAGDVIPDIIKVFPELRSGKEKDFKMPKVCPVCKSDLFKPQGQIMWYCPNKSCFAQLRRSFYHFVSKPAFNIVGLGPKIIDRLIDEGLVSTPPDLFNLKEGDISHLERFAEKSAKNLINSIQSRKEIALPNLIYALGIRNVGEKTALDLVNHFGSLEKIMNASIEELSSVKDIGPVVAESIYKWFRDKKNLEILKKIKEVGIKIITINSSDNLKLKGKNFVFTGTLSSMSRQEAKKRVIEQGGEVSESVSKKTDYVVVGENPGSKLKKALDLGVKIIKEEDFLKMI